MKKKIYEFFLYISLLLIKIGVKLNNPQLCALIIYLNIRKSKEFKYSEKNKKKILVFPKTGGYEDLLETYKNHYNSFNFFILPRFFLKKIFSIFFEKKFMKDYFTKSINIKKIEKKKYIDFLTNIFFYLEKFIKIDGFISFNVFYYAEKHLEEVFRILKKKYIILHKESTFTPIEEINAAKVYKKYNDRSLAYKISVYSESQRKILIKSKIASRNKINVNGCPRSDFAFGLRKIKPKKRILVYYLIEKNRGSNLILTKLNLNWSKLYDQTLEYLLDFAKKNSNIKIIFKGKIGVHKKEDFDSIVLPKNCSFVTGSTGEKLLRDASAVVAFNSMIIFETIASNRNLIIPNFNNERQKKSKMILKIKNKKYFTNSKEHFFKQLNFYLNSNYTNKKLSKSDEGTLKYYLGVIDGKSGKKVKNFLEKSFN